MVDEGRDRGKEGEGGMEKERKKWREGRRETEGMIKTEVRRG